MESGSSELRYVLVTDIYLSPPDYLSPVEYNGISVEDGIKTERPIKKIIVEPVGTNGDEILQLEDELQKAEIEANGQTTKKILELRGS